MRFSPVLVAFLATAATLGLSNSAKGQTAHSPSSDKEPSHFHPVTTGGPPIFKPINVGVGTSIGSPIKVKPAPGPLGAGVSPSRLLQAQGPGTPNPISPGDAGTPLQATPDQIQLTPRPASPPPTLQVPEELKPEPTSPTTPPQPTPTPEQPVPAEPPSEEKPAPTEQPTPTPEQPVPTPPAEETKEPEPEPRVLVAEVEVRGVEGPIQEEVYKVIRTQPGRTTTRSQLQEDINAIFATGYFSNVRAVPEDTPLGVRVTFEVALNPVLQKVQVEGTTVLPPSVVEDAFKDQYGSVLNLVQLQEGIKQVNKWYQDNGYVLAQVVDAPRVSPDGVVTLEVAEGVVEDIQVRFVNKEGEDKDAKGNPIRGKTRPFIITREFQTKPGDVFNRAQVERDLQRVFGLGIFEDVKLSLQPGAQDPRKVVVVANVAERNTGSIAAGAGISSASGLFGTVSFQQQNFGGNNQKLGAEVQIGQRELLFDLSFTDPWIGGDPFRTSYTLNLFRRRTISLIFDGGDPEVRLPADRDGDRDRPRVVRTGGGISFSRPLNGNPYQRAEWSASLGLQYQRVKITDSEGDISPRDELGNCLSFPSSRCRGKNDLFSVQFGIVRDLRDDPLRPTRGSIFRAGTEQWLPLGLGSVFGNRVRAGYSFYIPTQFVKFTQGCRGKNPTGAQCPQALAFNIQAGTVIGDLPPYEAFALGGSNSVRGYDEGDLAAARSYLQATVEYRFPIFSIISGALFVDAATDFGSQDNVPGNPGGVRNKPGSGIGYGAGVRVQSPLGPIRIDFGINDQGDTRFHFGIGERF
jgi:outer membrane protein insertion porin family